VAHLAPAPNDIVWQNTYTTHRQRLVRGWSVTVISGLVSLLWATPIGALSGFLDPAYLAKVLPAVADFFNSKSILAVFVQGFLPTFLYTLFNGLAPFIFDWLSSWQGFISIADAELANVSKYGRFSISLISGTFFIFSSISSSTYYLDHLPI
jgi:calcium permeable stress-gated cation channel